ncbi:MAG: hypothetical protein ABI596_00325 [Pyrinomonadaceae bacterium]
MSHRVIRLGIFLFVLAFIPSTAQGQGFPWKDFERRTMPELLKINDLEEAENLKRFPDQNQFVFRGTRLPSVVSLTYTGESRALSSERNKFIELWATSYYRNPGYANLYNAEFLFKDGNEEHWLPVQKDVAKYFPEELKKGELVDLYLISPGGLRGTNKGKTLWVFLVEQFGDPRE